MVALTRRDEIWETKRKARLDNKRLSATVPPPPRVVVPEPRSSSHLHPLPPNSNPPAPPTSPPPPSSHHEATQSSPSNFIESSWLGEDHGLPTHHHKGDRDGGEVSSSSYHQDPVFQALVEAEMRKMEQQFQTQLHVSDVDGGGGLSDAHGEPSKDEGPMTPIKDEASVAPDALARARAGRMGPLPCDHDRRNKQPPA